MSDKQYSTVTTNQYNSCITSIRRIYIDTLKQDFTIPQSLQNHKQIYDLLSNVHKKPTIMNYLSAILWKLRKDHPDTSDLQQSYHEYAKQLKAEIEREKIGKEFDLTDKEIKSFMLWEDILTIYQTVSSSLDRQNYNSFLDFVILSLYIIHPPVRADYANMRIFIDESSVPDNFTENYCVLQTNPRFVFQQYKNSKHKGNTVISIDPELHDILLDWIEINPSDYLLSSYVISKNIYKPFTETTLCKRITSIFMKYSNTPVTINTLRHSFISFISKHDQLVDIKKENANKMMHSLSMADKYRRMVYI
jgi:integrase